MTLHEPDVSLTDFGLAVECGVFVALLAGRDASFDLLNGSFMVFFAATGLAAFLGALAHGFVTDRQSILYRNLWIGIFASIGIAAVASWAIGSALILTDAVKVVVLTAAAIAFAIYIAAVLRVSQSFAVAILHYLPAALFLLIAFIVAFSISHELPLFLGITGVVLTFVAALVQQIKLRLHAKYFDHNAFYHLIQAVALLLLFLSAWRLPQPHVI